MAQLTKEQLEDIIQNRNKNFSGMRLHGSDFSGLDLQNANFRLSICHYCNFDDTNCRNTNFEGAGLQETHWKGSDLHRANMKNASLCNADLRGAKDLYGITLTMECKSLMGLKVDPGFWYGFLFYGLLMEPPSIDEKEKLIMFMGSERYSTLRRLYAVRQV